MTTNLRINNYFEYLLTKKNSDHLNEDPLILDYRNYLDSKKNKKVEAPPPKPKCPLVTCAEKFPEIKNLSYSVQKIFKSANVTRRIKKECIEASLQRTVDNVGYYCDGQKDKIAVFDNKDYPPCIKEQLVDFLHYSVNQAINCFSSIRQSIDTRFILKKINNESAFNFFLAYGGGVGLSMLTSAPINDTFGYRNKEGDFIPGRVKNILKEIQSSQYPSCKPFIEIINKDLKKRPHNPYDNVCAWTKVGEGIGRNLIYSLAYYVFNRDVTIKQNFEKEFGKVPKNKNLINYLTLMSYGPGGPNEAMAQLQILRLDSNPTLISDLIKNSTYLNDTEAKMKELLEVIKGNNPEEFNKIPFSKHLAGDTCLEPE